MVDSRNKIRPNKKIERLGQTKSNKYGNVMKIIEYNNNTDIVVEFQDEHKAKIHTIYNNFASGNVKNPYHPSVFDVGIIGNKYSSKINGKTTKEYSAWLQMLRRCFDNKLKDRYPTYRGVTCCEEWLLFENFYEWLHSQENFDKWLNEKQWTIDKDIMVKSNKIYSPKTCCLVPNNVNVLFTNRKPNKGTLVNGVKKVGSRFQAFYSHYGDYVYIGTYNTLEDAFLAYKQYKESYIKQIAQEEYYKKNITKKCYDAMMEYKVEIAD